MSQSESVASLFRQCILEASYKERDEDWAGAYKLWVRAEGLLAAAPDFEKDGIRTAWRSAEGARHIQRLEMLKQQQAGIGELQRIPVEYVNPGCESDD